MGNRAFGDRLATLIEPAAQRLAAALLLLSPQTPLLFMGEEYGETRPFPFFCSFQDESLNKAVRQGRKREFAEQAHHADGKIPDATAETTFQHAKLSWQWHDDPQRSGLRELYQQLLRARRNWPSLQDRSHCSARIIGTDPSSPILLMERGHDSPLIALANLTGRPVEIPGEVSRSPNILLSTAEHRFGGPRTALSPLAELSPWELVIWGDSTWS